MNMHYIVQLSTKPTMDRVSEYDLYEFMSNGQYVLEITKEHQTLVKENLVNGLSNVAKYKKEEGSLVFKEGARQLYFKERYEDFINAANSISLDVFAGDLDPFAVHNIRQLIENTFSLYVLWDYGYCSLDYFIREHMKVGKPLYIGEIFKYDYS